MNWWSILNGTIVNAATVAVGSTIGLAFSSRIPDRFQRTILTCLGLMTVILAVDAGVIEMGRTVQRWGVDSDGIRLPTYGARVAMVVVGSLIVGAVIGTGLRLHERLEGLGRVIHERFGRSNRFDAKADEVKPGGSSDRLPASARFAEGFLTASVIFCVGPLTLLGCLNNGASGDPSLLYIKSFLDGFCSMALAASLGAGVACSIATVLVFQGGLAITAAWLGGSINELSLSLMNVVGGMLLLATAMMILDIKKIPVADLLPGICLPVVIVALIERFMPGTLILVQ